jgi:hypothetical protein
MSIHFYTSLIRLPRRDNVPDAWLPEGFAAALRSRRYREWAYFSSQAWRPSIRHFSKKPANGLRTR